MRKFILLPCVFAAGALTLLGLEKAGRFFGEWRIIQILETADGKHTAELSRLYGYIDVNFRIELDGERVYWSPDFVPDRTRAFREWITWDEEQKNLVFVAADRVLFAYDLATRTPVPNEKLASLVISKASLADLGFEGTSKGADLRPIASGSRD